MTTRQQSDQPLQLYHHFLRYEASKMGLRADDIVPVDSQDAADYIWMFSSSVMGQTTRAVIDDLPTVMPPWGLAWYEWELRQDHFDHRPHPPSKRGTQRFGALIVQADSARDAWERGVEMPPDDLPADAEHAITLFGFAMVDGVFETMATPLTYFLDALGQVVNTIAPMREEIDEDDGEPVWVIPSDEEQGMTEAMMLPAFLTMAWVHTNKTKVVSATFGKRDEKMVARGKIVKHRKVIIEAFKDRERVMEFYESTGKLPHHMVRGHFRDYRKHGVAGNPKARGIYWVPAFWRGNPGSGHITKQYDVTHPDLPEKTYPAT